MKPDRRRLFLALGSVAVVAVLSYANTLSNGFALDDEGIIQKNTRVHGLARLGDAVTGPYWPGEPAERGLYRPFTMATYAVNWAAGGGSATWFHLVNLLLHAAVTGLVLLFLLPLAGDLAAAWAGALIFAVHPVHVEAVANIVGRAEILATLFFLAGCLVVLRARGRGWGVAAAVAAAFFMGLASKENAIMLPVVLALLETWQARGVRPGVQRIVAGWRLWLSMAVALVVYFALRRANIGVFLGIEKPPWFWGMPSSVRVLTAIRVWPEYLRLMVLPIALVPDYGPGVIVPRTSLLQPLVLLGLLTAAVAAFVAWRARRGAPLLSAGIVWFAITVLPVTGLLFPVGFILAERTLYLPSVGVALAVAAGVVWARSAAPARAWRAAVAGLLLIVGAAALRVWTANPVWEDTNTVLNHLLREHPANYRAQWGMASTLAAEGDTASALAHYEIATRMVPGYYNLRFEYGTILAANRDYGAAAAQFDTALQVLPTATRARLNEVATLVLDGRPAQAATVAAAGLAPDGPAQPQLYDYYSRALARSGRYGEAIRARRRAIHLAGEAVPWSQWGHLAGLALLAGDTATARTALERARASASAGVHVPSPDELARRIQAEGGAAIPSW